MPSHEALTKISSLLQELTSRVQDPQNVALLQEIQTLLNGVREDVGRVRDLEPVKDWHEKELARLESEIHELKSREASTEIPAYETFSECERKILFYLFQMGGTYISVTYLRDAGGDDRLGMFEAGIENLLRLGLIKIPFMSTGVQVTKYAISSRGQRLVMASLG